MNKRLIYSYSDRISARQKYVDELVKTCNQLLTIYQSRHNHFGQTIDESFAFQLVSQPVRLFDELLKANSPIKPIAGKELDIIKLAELVGIDRNGFIKDFTVVMPNSRDQYNRNGVIALFSLKDEDREVLVWKDGNFAINEAILSKQLDMFNVYATNEKQLKELNYWENLATTLNVASDRMRLDKMDIGHIARLLDLQDPLTKEAAGRFAPNYRKIAESLKNLV